MDDQNDQAETAEREDCDKRVLTNDFIQIEEISVGYVVSIDGKKIHFKCINAAKKHVIKYVSSL